MEEIYLDHISAKPVDPRVVEFALPYLNEKFGNPSSLHAPGLMAKSVVEDARKKVADLINADDGSTIIFTSGATDANNLAIKGTALRNINKGKVIAASAIEHISVLNPMKDLQKNGFTFNTIPVDPEGVVDIGQLKDILTEDTTIVSVMYANNEIGTIQPIGEISKIVHEKGAYLHVDATDSAGFVDIDVQSDGIDL